eukprot:2999712-Amphidinium_carterae.1
MLISGCDHSDHGVAQADDKHYADHVPAQCTDKAEMSCVFNPHGRVRAFLLACVGVCVYGQVPHCIGNSCPNCSLQFEAVQAVQHHRARNRCAA